MTQELSHNIKTQQKGNLPRRTLQLSHGSLVQEAYLKRLSDWMLQQQAGGAVRQPMVSQLLDAPSSSSHLQKTFLPEPL